MRRSCLGALLVPAVIALVAVAVLAGALDRGSAYVVSRSVASQLSSSGVEGPEVEFDGFPYLPQLLRREFDTVHVRADGVTRSDFTGTDVVVELHGVRPEGSQAVRAERATGQVTVPYSRIESAAGQPAGSLSTVGQQVRVHRSAEVLGRTLTLTGSASLQVVGDRVLIAPRTVQVSGTSLPVGGLLEAARDAVRVGYVLTGLPQGLRVTGVQPVAGGLRVDFQGQDLLLSR